jgi:hypothetical protein
VVCRREQDSNYAGVELDSAGQLITEALVARFTKLD